MAQWLSRLRAPRSALATVRCVCALCLVGIPIRPVKAVASTFQPNVEADPSTSTSSTAEDQGPPQPPKSAPTPDDERTEEVRRQFEQHFSAGSERFHEGAYIEAAEEFEKAFSVGQHEKALYNAQLSYKLGGDLVAAANTARRYLEVSDCQGPQPDPPEQPSCIDRRSLMEQALRTLPRQLVELRLSSTARAELREIRVNGKVIPPGEFPIFVVPGTVDLEIIGSAQGQHRARRVELGAGTSYRIELPTFDTPRVDPPKPAPLVSVPGPAPLPRKDPRRILVPTFWASVFFTGASATAMTTAAGLTLRAYRRYRDNRCGPVVDPPGSCAYPSADEEQFNRLRPVTNALIGVTAGLAVTTAILGVFAFRKSHRANPQRRAQTRVAFDGAGLVLRY